MNDMRAASWSTTTSRRDLHKAGHWVWVHDRGRIVEWTPDWQTAAWMVGMREDITERKQQDELRAAKEQRGRQRIGRKVSSWRP
ncbi:MAG: hypothetical protein R2763_00365 [Mycobacterium sp.]